MRREFSAGGIVFNKKGQVLLIRNASIKDYKINYWGLPKGHIEEGQTAKEAALREVGEEAGVEAEIVDKVGDVKYIFTKSGEKIFKIVIYFLMRYVSGDPKNHDREVLEAGWFSPKDTFQRLSFKHDKDMLKKALDLIENHKL